MIPTRMVETAKALQSLTTSRQPLYLLPPLTADDVGHQIEDDAVSGIAQADAEEENHEGGEEIGGIEISVFGVAVEFEQGLDPPDEPVVLIEDRRLLLRQRLTELHLERKALLPRPVSAVPPLYWREPNPEGRRGTPRHKAFPCCSR